MPYNFEERYNEIREELIKQGYANKHITYSEFLAIYEPYKEEMSEKEFIQVLGISYTNLQSIKHKNKRAIILKQEKLTDEKKKIEELKQFIISDLRKRRIYRKKIDYNEFLSLYEPYKEKLKESEFASILGISYASWQSMKNKGTRAIILKPEKSDDEKKELENLKQFIISDLRKRGYTEKKIDYNEFLSLYEPYKEKFKESEFANILGISYGSFSNIKYNGKKAIILKPERSTDEKKKIEELRQFIASDLIQKGYRNKSIDYNEFLRLYKPYKEKFKESEFANILGISYSNWRNIKYYGQRAKILKKEKSDDEKKELENLKQFIISDLIERGYTNQKIDYNEFLRLYEPYKEKLKESEFANILGISYSSWQNIKNKAQKALINFEYIYYIRILHLFKESKEYDLAYFEEVSKNIGLPVSKIVEILTEEKTNLEELLNALYKKGKIFIGKTKISEIFIQKYGEMISDIIHKYSKSIGRKLHTSFYSEDFAQESILWVIENKGSIERNFEGDTALQRMIACAKARCKYLHYKVFKQKKVVSLDESISEDGKLTRYTRVKAKENVQKDVEKIEEKIEISEGDTPITAIQQCLINGMNREESLAFVMQKFNLTQEELLQVLTEELSKRNSIKVAQNGEVYLGGRDIDD